MQKGTPKCLEWAAAAHLYRHGCARTGVCAHVRLALGLDMCAGARTGAAQEQSSGHNRSAQRVCPHPYGRIWPVGSVPAPVWAHMLSRVMASDAPVRARAHMPEMCASPRCARTRHTCLSCVLALDGSVYGRARRPVQIRPQPHITPTSPSTVGKDPPLPHQLLTQAHHFHHHVLTAIRGGVSRDRGPPSRSPGITRGFFGGV